MSNLKYRLLVIGALVVASIWALFPRTVVERVRRNGTIVQDTVRRVPLKRGLDLQGGMHLALEVDESKGTVANKFIVDGLNVTSGIRQGVLNLTPNPDAIQETSIQVNTFSSEYGGGSSIQMASTKPSEFRAQRGPRGASTPALRSPAMPGGSLVVR